MSELDIHNVGSDTVDIEFESGGATFYSRRVDKTQTITWCVDMTPIAASAYVEAEHVRSSAARSRSEMSMRIAEEKTKQSKEETEQARQLTRQSGHRVIRVAIASIIALGGAICVVIAPAGGASIAEIMACLTVAVGVDAFVKTRKAGTVPLSISK
jgi:Flp pilus assembly protein TadB